MYSIAETFIPNTQLAQQQKKMLNKVETRHTALKTMITALMRYVPTISSATNRKEVKEHYNMYTNMVLLLKQVTSFPFQPARAISSARTIQSSENNSKVNK